MLRCASGRETGSRKGCRNCAVAGSATKNEKIAHFRVIFEQKRIKTRLFGPVFDGVQPKVAPLGAAAFGFSRFRAVPMSAR
jgi:hypothetical protein